MNTVGMPAVSLSPCKEWKISLTRKESPALVVDCAEFTLASANASPERFWLRRDSAVRGEILRQVALRQLDGVAAGLSVFPG